MISPTDVKNILISIPKIQIGIKTVTWDSIDVSPQGVNLKLGGDLQAIVVADPATTVQLLKTNGPSFKPAGTDQKSGALVVSLIHRVSNWVYKPTPASVSTSDKLGYSLYQAIELAKQEQRNDLVKIDINGKISFVKTVLRESEEGLILIDVNRIPVAFIRTLPHDFLVNGVWSQIAEHSLIKECRDVIGKKASDIVNRYTVKVLDDKGFAALPVNPQLGRKLVFGPKCQVFTPVRGRWDYVCFGIRLYLIQSGTGVYSLTSSDKLWSINGPIPNGPFTPVWKMTQNVKENVINFDSSARPIQSLVNKILIRL